MRTQYITYSKGVERKVHKLGVQYQNDRNADILAGELDLPSIHASEHDFETRLKILALFFEHAFIPDGWLHCSGPVTRYLRQKLSKFKDIEKASYDSDFTQNVFFKMLESGIAVPLLRGERPSINSDSYKGYNLYDVWKGNQLNSRGEGFGVYFKDTAQGSGKRMMILDQEDTTNDFLIQAISKRIVKFSDWNVPSLAIDESHSSENQILSNWDKEFAEKSIHSLSDESNNILHHNLVDFFKDSMFNLDRETSIRLHNFEEKLNHYLSKIDITEGGVRRGTFEQAIAKSFDKERISDYREINELGLAYLKNPFFLYSESASKFICPEALYSRHILDKISTVQEALFSKNLNCSSAFETEYSHDALDRHLLQSASLQIECDRFKEAFIGFSQMPINISGLTFDQIKTLRESVGQNYFKALASIEPAYDFWGHNKHYVEALRAYLKEIAKAAPAGKWVKNTSEIVTEKLITIGGSAVFNLIARDNVALLTFGNVAFFTWTLRTAKEVLPYLIDYVASYAGAEVAELVKKKRANRKVDLTLKLLGVPNELRSDIRN